MSITTITVRLPDDLAAAFKAFKESNEHKSDNSAAIALFREYLMPHKVRQTHAALLPHKMADSAFAEGEIEALTAKLAEFSAFKDSVLAFMGRSLEGMRAYLEDEGRELSPMEQVIDKMDELGGDVSVLRMRFAEHTHHADGKLSDPRGERMARRQRQREIEEVGVVVPVSAPVPVADPAAIAAAKVKREAEEAAAKKKAEDEAAAKAVKLRETREYLVTGMIGEIERLVGHSTTVTMLHATQKILGQELYVVTPEQQQAIDANDAKAKEIAAANADEANATPAKEGAL